MKRALYLLLGCLPHPVAGCEYSSAKTATGILVAHETPDFRYTVEIPGRTVEPQEQPERFSIKLDETLFQVRTVTRDGIFGSPVEISPKGLLLAHRDWEAKHIGKSWNAKAVMESALVGMKDGIDALSWSCAMPKGTDARGTQHFLTRAVGTRVIVLSATASQSTKEDDLRKKLVSAGNSLRVHDGPIDFAKLQESLKNPPPAVADAKDSGGTYEFPLNQRGGGIRIVSGAKPPRLEFYDDYGDGVEVTWESKLTPNEDGSWRTDRGLVVSVRKLAEPRTSGGKRCDWKLKISGKNPGFREHQKVLPLVDFGDPENGEYFGELSAE